MDEQLHFCTPVIATATSLSKPLFFFNTWNDKIYDPPQREESPKIDPQCFCSI